MAVSKVVVVDGNNLIVRIDRGVAGRGITDVEPVEIDNALYLEFTFSDGTTETVGPVGVIQYVGTAPIVVAGANISLSTVPINLGGTNATTAANARTNLNAANQDTTITAGTGLSGGGSLAANRTINIANTAVTAGAYGSASNTLSATVNAQGQLTALAATPIAVANTQISGLGTMSTQNASSVAITGGSITGITDLAVADGGTGASDAAGARTNLNAANQATTITAGTGLSGGGDLSANRTIDIANTTVTAGSFGSASNTLTATVNAQGQLTALAATPIAVANTQVSGLGTMSTQNANSVAITGGSITGITDLAVLDGGTGASDASGARTNLGAAASATTITAGTGLSGGGDLSANRTLAIANTAVTAGSFGSASNTLTATVNAQGQLTALAATPIAIANTQVSGLGTASVLNAGVALGVATLDAGGTVPLSQIPASIQGGVSYQGSWNASTNTPTLTSSVGSKGYYYVVSVAGSTNLNGITDWLPGDWAIYNGTAWEKIDNTDSVASVNGYVGAVVLNAADVGAPPTTRSISTGTGLTGGGNLSADRTIAIDSTVATLTGTQILTNKTINLASNTLQATSAEIAAAVTDETGSGALVFANSPTLVTPALGTPSALVGTNITGTAAGLTAGNVTTNANLTGAITSTGNATLLGSFSSANLAGALTDETGTGSAVFANSPTLVTPALGTPASGVVTNLTGTASININGTVGATTATTGAFTTLSASSDVTLSGGTANGVTYLNGSKVLTSGSALTFDGEKLAFGSAVSHQQLDINLSTGGPSWNFGYIRLGSAAGDMLTWGGGASAYADIVTLKNPTNNPLIFGVNNSEQMRLTSTGLGIGTSSPVEKLSVNGGIVSTFGANLTSGAGSYLYYTSATTSAELTALNPGVAWLNQKYSALTHAWNISGSEQMRLTSTGLGIGTSSPVSKLDVAGAGSNVGFKLRSGGNSGVNILDIGDTAGAGQLVLDASGNLGVGTSSPGARLSLISGTGSNNGITLQASGWAYYGRIGMNGTSGGEQYWTANYSFATSAVDSASYYSTYIQNSAGQGIIAFGTSSGVNTAPTERMRLDSSGNLGIGTSSPGTKLEVAGAAPTIKITANNATQAGLQLTQEGVGNWLKYFRVSDSAFVEQFGGTDLLFLSTSGNLGLGVTPSAWNSYFKAMQFGSSGGFVTAPSGTQSQLFLGANGYSDSGGTWRYINSAAATRYWHDAGAHKWDIAPSGTAGDAISFTQAMTLDASGRLGIGATSPSFTLVVASADPAIQVKRGALNGILINQFDGTGNSSINLVDNAALIFGTNNTERARIDSSGNLGIGTSSPLTPLYVRKDQAAATYVTVDNVGTVGASTSAGFACAEGGTVQGFFRSLRDGSGQIQLYNAGAYPLVFGTNNTERARITSGGDLLVGTTSAARSGDRLSVVGAGTQVATFRNDTNTSGYSAISTVLQSNGNNTSSYHLWANTDGGGNWYLYGNGTSSFSSDQRLKKNIATTRNGYIQDLCKLRVVKYNWKNDADGTPQELGLIAQEVEQVFPGLVQDDLNPIEEGGEIYKQVKQSVLPFMLLKAIQEQQAIIESLKARLDAANL